MNAKTMSVKAKQARYERIFTQISGLMTKTTDPFARMATISAILHHKFDYYFWTGFYRLIEGELTVVSYQGSVACQTLAKGVGVCWAAFNQKKTLVIKNVHEFPGHIACDSRSQSEVVVPVRNKAGEIVAVLDVDSKELASFDEIDAENLKKIVKLIYS